MSYFLENRILKDKMEPELLKKWNNLKIQKSTQPNDIIWKNFGLTSFEKLIRRLITIIAAAVLIIACFWAVTGIQVGSRKFEGAYQDSDFIVFFTVLISIIIVILNFLLKMALIFFTDIEQRLTYTFYQFSLIWKITIATFLNTAFVIILVKNVFDDIPIYKLDGIANQIFIQMIISIFTNIILGFLDPTFLILKLKRWYLLYKYNNPEKKEQVFQYQLHEAMEGIEFSLSNIIILNLKTFTLAIFYSAILPLGVLLACIEIFLTQYVWKYNLINRSKIPQDLQFVFCQYILIFLEFLLIFYSIGHMVFDGLILEKIPFVSWAFLIVTILSVTIFNTSFIFEFFKDNLSYDQTSFSENKFPTDYDRLNPMSQTEAYSKWLYEQGMLSEEDYKNMSEEKNYAKTIMDATLAN